MEIFTLELPAPYSLEFLKTGYEWVLDVNISSRTAHPDFVSKNISIYPDNIWFPFGNWTNILKLYSCMCNQTAWMALSLGMCTFVAVQCSSFFKVNCICSWKFIKAIYCKFALHLRAEPATVSVWVPSPLAFDLLLTLGQQLTMNYTVCQWNEFHLLMWKDICYSPAGRSVLGKTVPEVSSRTRDRGHSFSQYRPTKAGE